ncbi:MAG TPA: hypothetical protein VJT84_11410 [Gaiellaceae bacterium]|nr:hypothetical protein [Gaiellaceae bacterium]
MSRRYRFGRALLGICVGVAIVASTAAARPAATAGQAAAKLVWTDCGDGYECSSLDVPRDYGKPGGPTFKLALLRLPAQSQRLGAVFVNFGGPGGTAVDTIHAIGRDLFGAFNDHFDIVGFDPRGVGQSEPSVDCRSIRRRTASIHSRSRRRSTCPSARWSTKTGTTSTAASR